MVKGINGNQTKGEKRNQLQRNKVDFFLKKLFSHLNIWFLNTCELIQGVNNLDE